MTRGTNRFSWSRWIYTVTIFCSDDFDLVATSPCYSKNPHAGGEGILPQMEGRFKIRNETLCIWRIVWWIVFLFHRSKNVGQDMRLTSYCLYMFSIIIIIPSWNHLLWFIWKMILNRQVWGISSKLFSTIRTHDVSVSRCTYRLFRRTNDVKYF